MPTVEKINPALYKKTKNSRGYMHPLSSLSHKFTLFAATAPKPVVDMGCAYGNTVIEALKSGAKTVVACDIEEQHLTELRSEIHGSELEARLITKTGQFPDGFNFEPDSLSAIHASHLFEYLRGSEVEEGLKNCFKWLQSDGKLFILTYTIYIHELVNEKLSQEYERRIENGVKWPGYLEDYDAYSSVEAPANSPFPKALHMYDLPVWLTALNSLGFIIEFADYLDGKTNGAAEETWHDGREYVGIVARKP